MIVAQLQDRLGAKWTTFFGAAIIVAQGAFDLGFLWFLQLPWQDPGDRSMRYMIGFALLGMKEGSKELDALKAKLAELEAALAAAQKPPA
jgi:hypothetical protein